MAPARTPRGRKPRLSRAEIVDAALAILAAEGPEKLSLRRLADDLDVTARALYSYFDSKDDLETALVLSVMPAPPSEVDPELPWHAQLRGFVLDIHDAIVRQPGVAQLFITRTAGNTATDRIREHLLRLLVAGGLIDDEALAALGTLSRYILGSAVIAGRRPSPMSADGVVARAAPGREFPILHELAEKYTDRNSMESTRYGLDVILRGLGAAADVTDTR